MVARARVRVLSGRTSESPGPRGRQVDVPFPFRPTALGRILLGWILAGVGARVVANSSGQSGMHMAYTLLQKSSLGLAVSLQLGCCL